MSTLSIVFLVLICNYATLTLFAHYLAIQKVNLIKMMIESKNPRKKQELLLSLRSEIRLLKSFYWPISIIKEMLDVAKKKK